MKLCKLFILLLVSINVFSQGFYEDRLFVKVKDVYAKDVELTENKEINSILKTEEVKEFKHAFISKEMHSVYIVLFRKSVKLEEYISKISEIGIVEYAEKIPIYNLFFTPNDPQISSQWNLAKIQATQAWNIHQGTTPVKIAITDDGFLMNHEDLTSQWAVNTAEIAANGVDDDGNGYIDDWRGWDAGNNDNDPSAVSPTNTTFTHGTHVAGISAAATNNSLGIASIGFNCKLIPVKIANNSGLLTGTYQGLDYAINAIQPDVINMSWGGGAQSNTYQLLFDLAYSKGIICVAAAGNNNSSSKMYPAAYNHVISVASTDNADAKSSFSNYGTWIDVSAPGSSILSCLAGSTSSYGNLSGTSMAAPLVSGLCALMKSYNPMPVDSIEACLKRTCDNINAQNSSYVGLIGSGRINALQALQCLTKKPMSQFQVRDTFQCTGKAVKYEATSIGIPTLTYQWSFPGGSPLTSTSKNQQVTYNSSGYKTATLITCNSIGCDTVTKTNVVYIDTPKAWLVGRNYTSYNTNAVIISVSFKGNPPFSVTLTDGTYNFTQNNIKSNPYYFSIVPVKDTSYITISSFSDSSCVGNKYGKDTIYKIINSNIGTTSYCESSFNFNGTYTNVVKIVPQNGSAWKDLYSTNGFTWECWFNLGNRSIGTAQESIVVASDAVLCEDLGLWFNFPWAGAGTFGFVASGQSGCSAPHVVASTTMSFSPNTWYHAAGVMDYTNNIVRLYVNGTQVATTALTLSMSQRMQNNVAVTIGNQDVNYNPYSGGFTPFKGKVDEVRFWNIVKTQAQIQADMKVCLPASTPNLVAYFKGDEGTGTNTVSKINGNFIGILQNNASWSTQVDSVKNCTICSNPGFLCKDSTIYYSDTSNWYYQNSSSVWVKASLGINSCSQWSHASWSPSVLIGLLSQNQMIWGDPSAGTCVVKRDINIPDVSKIDSVRILMQADDNVVAFKVNGTMVASTSFGWNNVASVKILNSSLINGVNTFSMQGTNSSSCAWLACKIIVYSSVVCGSDCDTTNLNSGLIAYYPLDGNTNDVSGNGHNGTAYGGLSYIAGKKGLAASYDGIDDYINVNSKLLQGKTSFAVAGWVYMNEKMVNDKQFNIYRENNAGWHGAGLDISIGHLGTSNYQFQAGWSNYSGGGMATHVVRNTSTDSGRWYCFVVTRDSGIIKLYLDGQFIQSNLDSFTNTPLSNGILGGWWYNNEPAHIGFTQGI